MAPLGGVNPLPLTADAATGAMMWVPKRGASWMWGLLAINGFTTALPSARAGFRITARFPVASASA